MDGLNNILAPIEGYPLGVVNTLVYTHYSLMGHMPIALRNVMPWSILSKVCSTLIRYHSVHQPEVVSSYPLWPGFALPGSADVRQLRRLCPKVTSLCLDIDEVNLNSDGFPAVLYELSQFPYLTSLMLYVHSPMHSASWLPWLPQLSWIPPHSSYRKTFFENLFVGILLLRKDDHQNLSVGFKEVHDWAVMCDNWQTPDWIFWLNKKGQLEHLKRDPEKDMEKKCEELRRQIWANLTPQALERELEAVDALIANGTNMAPGVMEYPFKELQRRLQLTELTAKYGDDSVTLYEALQPRI
jgi:hypothetical protein